MADRVWLYAVPTVAADSVDVEIASGPGAAAATVMESAFVAVAAVVAESVTFTVKLTVAAVVGVPEMTPVVLRVSPAGREPPEMDHL